MNKITRKATTLYSLLTIVVAFLLPQLLQLQLPLQISQSQIIQQLGI